MIVALRNERALALGLALCLGLAGCPGAPADPAGEGDDGAGPGAGNVTRELRLQDLGRPALPAPARQLNIIHPFEGKLYLGFGDWTENTGPSPVTYYDRELRYFDKVFEAPEQAIVRYRELDGKLVVPGIDGWGQHGNVLVREPGGWVVRRIGADPRHVYDVASLSGRWYAGVDAFVYASSDQGESWTRLHGVAEGARVQSRVTHLVAYQGRLYAFPLFADIGGFVARSDMRGPAEAFVFDGEAWSREDLLPPGYEQCAGAAVFRGEVVTYSYHRREALGASAPPWTGSGPKERVGVMNRFGPAGSAPVESPFSGGVRSFAVLGDRLLVLGTIGRSEVVGLTRDLEHWKLWTIPDAIDPLTAAWLDGRVYVGDSDGHLHGQVAAE